MATKYVSNFNVKNTQGDIENVTVKDPRFYQFYKNGEYKTYPQSIITQNVRYYIDGTNGNDNNDGLTSSTAFKTLQHFFDYTIQSGRFDARCYIISAGTYTANIFTLTSASIHISGTVDGVIVNLTNSASAIIALYQCHLNLSNVTLTGPGVYLDSGSCAIANSTLACELSSYGGYLYVSESIIYFIDATGCFISLNKPTFSGKGNNTQLLLLQNCTLYIVGSVSHDGTQKTGSFAEMYGCTVYMLSALAKLAGKFNTPPTYNTCVFMGTGTRLITLFQTSATLPTVTECRFARIQNANNFSLASGESGVIPIPLLGGMFSVAYDFGGYRHVKTFAVVASNKYEITETHIDANGTNWYVACCNFHINESTSGITIEIDRNGTKTNGTTYESTPTASAKYITIQYVQFSSF